MNPRSDLAPAAGWASTGKRQTSGYRVPVSVEPPDVSRRGRRATWPIDLIIAPSPRPRGDRPGDRLGPGRPVSAEVSVPGRHDRGIIEAPSSLVESVIWPVFIDVCEVSEGRHKP